MRTPQKNKSFPRLPTSRIHARCFFGRTEQREAANMNQSVAKSKCNLIRCCKQDLFDFIMWVRTSPPLDRHEEQTRVHRKSNGRRERNRMPCWRTPGPPEGSQKAETVAMTTVESRRKKEREEEVRYRRRRGKEWGSREGLAGLGLRSIWRRSVNGSELSVIIIKIIKWMVSIRFSGKNVSSHTMN